MTWVLAIDYGTTNTSAAAKDRRGAQVLDLAGRRQYPSCVHVDEHGEILTGADAENVAALFVGRFVATPKRRLAERTLVIGGVDVAVADLVAATLRAVFQEAVRSRGSSPANVVLTHPARWSPAQIAVLRDAAGAAGMNDVTMVAEPVAAARAFVGNFDVRPGAPFALFDLGGGTLDVAIVERVGDELRQIAAPGGLDPLGGEDFDVALTEHLLGSARVADDAAERLRNPQDLDARRQRRELRRAVRAAKETLSTNESAYVDVPGLSQPIVVTRAEFDDSIRSRVVEAVDELVRALERARVSRDDLDAVFLAGGSCRIPLVANEIRSRMPGVRVETVGDPKTVTAEGAALLTALPAESAATTATDPTTVANGRRPRRRSRRTLGASAAAVAVGGLVWAGFSVSAGGASSPSIPVPITRSDTPAETRPAETNPTPTDPAETNPAETNPPQTEPPRTDPSPTDPPGTDPPQTEPAVDDVARLYDRFPLLTHSSCELADLIEGLESYGEVCQLVEPSTGSSIWFSGAIVADGYDTSSYLQQLYLRPDVAWINDGTWNDPSGDERGLEMDFVWALDDGSTLTCRAWGDYSSDLVGWICGYDLFTVQQFWRANAA